MHESMGEAGIWLSYSGSATGISSTIQSAFYVVQNSCCGCQETFIELVNESYADDEALHTKVGQTLSLELLSR